MQMYRRLPINSFNEVGTCCSNSEINNYKSFAAVHFGSGIIGLGPGAFLQTKLIII